jgi:hypothetical protein
MRDRVITFRFGNEVSFDIAANDLLRDKAGKTYGTLYFEWVCHVISNTDG